MTPHKHLTVQTLSSQREASGRASLSLMNKTTLPGRLQLNSEASSGIMERYKQLGASNVKPSISQSVH